MAAFTGLRESAGSRSVTNVVQTVAFGFGARRLHFTNDGSATVFVSLATGQADTTTGFPLKSGETLDLSVSTDATIVGGFSAVCTSTATLRYGAWD